MLNKIQVIGNLGKDPEVRYTPGGAAVCSFSIATTEKWKDKNSGEMQEKTSWHNITAFGRLAEICGEYLKKGSKAFVEGRMEYSKYTDKQGVEKFTAQIVAKEMIMLDSRPSGGADADKPRNYEQGSGGNQGGNGGAGGNPQNQPQNNDFDDDIPF